MDQVPNKSQPRPTSYRETWRRHRRLLCLPIILGGLLGAFFAFGMTTTYTSSADIWVDTNPSAPSSIATSSGPLAEPPAAAEQGILSELLGTRSFAASVVGNSLLGKSLGSGATSEQKAAALGKVIQAAPGGQVLQISYSASSPAVARSVVAAIVAQLRSYTNHLTAQHNRAGLLFDKAQVSAATTALATARKNVSAYLAQNPGVTHSDPTYMSLVAAENNAATQLTQANTALSQVSGPGNGNSWSLQVIDPPSPASSMAAGKKKMVEVILGGALGGALVAFLAVVALTPAKKEEWEDELPIGGPFVPEGPASDPFRNGSRGVPAAPMQSASARPTVGPRLSLGDRRFQIRTPSVPSKDQ